MYSNTSKNIAIYQYNSIFFFHYGFLDILVHGIYFFHCLSRQFQVGNVIYDLLIKGAFSFDTITSPSFIVDNNYTPHVQCVNNNYYIIFLETLPIREIETPPKLLFMSYIFKIIQCCLKSINYVYSLLPVKLTTVLKRN